MRLNNRHPDDLPFDEAWRAYVTEDARLEAPPGLEARVWNELAAPPRPRANAIPRLFLVVSAAAVLVITFVALRGNSSRPPLPSSPIRVEAIAPPLEPAMMPAFERTREVERERPERRRLRSELPPVLMSLGASPVRDTEVLQLVRLRLPREALQTLGIAVLEPDAGGVVDVDVLIGEDGVARDIRQVRTGQEQETEPPW